MSNTKHTRNVVFKDGSRYKVDAVATINRQDAEIDRLKAINAELLEALDGMCSAYKAINEMMGVSYHLDAVSKYQAALLVIAKSKGEAQ